MIRFELNKGRHKIKIEKILEKAGKVVSKEFKKSGLVSVAVVSGGTVRKVNKKYRKKDKATDILTFVFEDGPYLGEIILSPKDVQRRAKNSARTFGEATAFLIIHGVLHIMGYTHKNNADAKRMESKEQELLKKLDL